MRILNMHRHKKEVEEAIRNGTFMRIDRATRWGNPFSHLDNTKAQFKVETREEAISKYREWILTQPALLERLPELRGKVLGCWCKPNACHGDVLLELLGEEVDLVEKSSYISSSGDPGNDVY